LVLWLVLNVLVVAAVHVEALVLAVLVVAHTLKLFPQHYRLVSYAMSQLVLEAQQDLLQLMVVTPGLIPAILPLQVQPLEL
jgi:hypothetical protein